MNSSLLFFLLLCVAMAPVPCLAQGLSRDEIIQKEMNCVDQRLKGNDELDWDNVCYMQEDFPDQRDDAVSEQLDAVQQVNDERRKRQIDRQYDEDIDDDIEDQGPLPVPRYMAPADDGYKATGQGGSTVLSKTHQVSLDREMYFAKYDEPGVMHQEGSMGGFNLKYTYRPKEDDLFYFKELDMYRAQLQWASGKFDYTSNGTGTLENKDDFTLELKGVLGKDYHSSPEVRATPYFGFGYRYLLDEGEGRYSSTGNWGYDRVSNYYYFPLGVDYTYQVRPEYAFDANAEFDYMFRGKQISKLGYVAGHNDVTNTQKSGYGLRGSLKFTRFFKKHSIFAEGFFRYWNIGQSEVAYDASTPLVEPKNTTEEIGLRLGLEI